ncbi:MAG TPA: hypothetical protein ENN46_02185 [Candidatus Woesearchaeota archaeon]|nr:hypothetical protein [Candidatus Woesearchaeota archaeon]
MMELSALELVTRLLYVFLIIACGILLSRLASRGFVKLRRIKKGIIENGAAAVSGIAEKLIVIVFLIIALFYLGFSSYEAVLLPFVDAVPRVITVVLLFVIGVFIINLVISLIKLFISKTGIEDYLVEEDSVHILRIALVLVKVLLYLLLINIVAIASDFPIVREMLGMIVLPAVGFLIAVFFVGIINPARDYVGGVYLKKVYKLKPGTSIDFQDKAYEVEKVHNLHTELVSGGNRFFLVPNRILSSGIIAFGKRSREIESLEKIKENYFAQLPSHCGPASAQIVLSFFGIESDQKELGKLMKTITRTREDEAAGTHPKKLISAVENFTNKEVIGCWLDYDKISNLKKEAREWLGEGALLIVDYKKKYLFPNSKRAHYSVAVGVKGDELLVVDPSSKAGGVYFSDYRDIEAGMNTHSRLIKGKRGYVVLAPKGTPAYRRIKDGLVYSDINMYQKATKALKDKLNKFTSSVTLYETFPPFIRKHLKDFEREQVRRVWKPNQKK